MKELMMVWCLFAKCEPLPIKAICMGTIVYHKYPNSDFLFQTAWRCNRKKKLPEVDPKDLPKGPLESTEEPDLRVNRESNSEPNVSYKD